MSGERYTQAMTDTVNAVVVDPEILGGKPCFAGTRVPIKTLFDALARGRSLDYFLEQYPSVDVTLVRDVLSAADRLVGSHAVPAAAA